MTKMNQDINIDDILNEFERKDDSFHPSTSKHKDVSLAKDGNLYDQLVVTMLNERMAPELLPYRHDLLKEVLDRISVQQQYLLDSHEYGDSNVDSGVISADFKLQLMIIETEIERLNYLVRLYLRTRLSKIDQFSIFYINATSQGGQNRSLLSEPEIQYMEQHSKILTQLYNDCFLRKLPEFLTLLDDTSGGQSMISEPDLNRLVFIKVLTSMPLNIKLSDDEDLELIQNGIYVVKYSLVRDYIEIGDIVLI